MYMLFKLNVKCNIQNTLILKVDSVAFFAAYRLGWAKCVSAEHTLSKRPIAKGGAAVNT